MAIWIAAMLSVRHARESVLPAGRPLHCLITSWARVGVSQLQQLELQVQVMRCSCLCSVAWAASCGESTADALPALLVSLPCGLGSQLLSKACALFAFS